MLRSSHSSVVVSVHAYGSNWPVTASCKRHKLPDLGRSRSVARVRYNGHPLDVSLLPVFSPHHFIELLLLLQNPSLDFFTIILGWRHCLRTSICSRIHVGHGCRVAHGIDEFFPLLLKLALSLRALRDVKRVAFLCNVFNNGLQH
ncbi:hypothetical protein BSLA_01r2882 [Burkholderia stabilis]|nr:hypothetical protein BSLA_01r2882 [Burkholderia stabilis]